KLADGTVVKIDESVKHNGEGTTPNTSFTFIGVPDDTQPTTGGEEVPKTGDATVAMFAVLAVLAMGAVVVFAKKRSF
ncbi:MAG: LPXTG cell wall anchor domain-containing protein, partial [Clostridia bacterium]|nr:LPXTG cell wall anchor domain-containing protein [Clostridia bacterium]